MKLEDTPSKNLDILLEDGWEYTTDKFADYEIWIRGNDVAMYDRSKDKIVRKYIANEKVK